MAPDLCGPGIAFVARRWCRVGFLTLLPKAARARDHGFAELTAFGLERDIAERELAWTPLTVGNIKPAVISIVVPRTRSAPNYTMAFIDILKREFASAATVLDS